MTTPRKHRHPHSHAQISRPLVEAPRLTRLCGPAWSAPSPSVTVDRWYRPGKRVAAVDDRPPRPSGSIAPAAGRYPCSRTLGSISC